ncbi:nuclear transport factor 2 family protein [Demequina phytophila]|uniref:nuclear transport factor 2 family protein n=1 Tax=Demequina phytophila TaxID=1638981 RepID=UPI000AB0E8F8|nr:nuclear transport factor 2 family protein [Demequina phytophila]
MHDVERLEREAWEAASGGDPREFYGRVLAPGAVMVLPEVGVLDREEAVESMATTQPWDVHSLEDVQVIEPSGVMAVVVYRARAIVWDTERVSYITSAYTRIDGDWRLLVHQRTPAAHPS